MTLTRRQHRLILALSCLASMLFVSFALQSLSALGWHNAYAQAAPDPLAQPGETFSLLDKLYHSGAYVALAIMVAFYGTRFAGAHVKRPNIAHWLAIAAGVLALLVPVAMQGSTPNLGMLIAAIVPSLALLAPGLMPSSSTPQPSRAASGGFVSPRLLALLAALAVAGGVTLESCTKTEATIKDTATCLESDAVKNIEPTILAILTSGGTLYDKLLAALAENKELGPDLIDCAVRAVKADLLAKLGAAPGNADAIKRADAWLGRNKGAAINSRDFPHGLAAAVAPTPGGCDSASIMQAAACVDGWTPVHDGCHWRCERPGAAGSFSP